MLTTLVGAQCDPEWQPGIGAQGVAGQVYTTATWDPDGAGPLAPRVVVAGLFDVAGNVPANNIAAYDPIAGTWSTFGSGIAGGVDALAVLPNGELIVGGTFSSAGGVAASRIARWNGSSWLPLGAGVDGVVSALAAHPSGDLYVGGQFTMAGGQQAFYMARWDGSTWSPVGLGMNQQVLSLDVMPNGDVVAGGRFLVAGSVLASGLARWDGAQWSEIGGGIAATSGLVIVNDVHAAVSGELVVAGIFDTAGGVPAVGAARWDGTSWSGLGLEMFSEVLSVTQLPGGDVVAAGSLVLPGLGNQAKVARRSQTGAWLILEPNTGSFVQHLQLLPGGQVVATGSFEAIGGRIAAGIALWDTVNWYPLANGSNGGVFASRFLANGDLVIGGSFTVVDGVPANSVARWNGQNWAPLGIGVGFGPGVGGTVYAIEELPNGDIVVGGQFALAGGVLSTCIARWDGSSWLSMNGLGLAQGTLPSVVALEVLSNGDLVVGGFFDEVAGAPAPGLATWNGSGWTPFPGLVASFGSTIRDALVLASGDLVIAGGFQAIGSQAVQGILRWDGAAWNAFGGGIDFDVSALAELPNGDLVAGGWFLQAGSVAAQNVALWDGSSWSAMAAGLNQPVAVLQALPNGDVVAGGQFESSGGLAVAHLARWNGAAWNAVDGGANSIVATLELDARGDLIVGGQFNVVGDPASASGAKVSVGLARLRSPCPATVVESGSGCVGSGGLVELSATSLPWLGGTFVSAATGMPSSSLAIEVRGLGTTSIPLSNVLAQAAPGCTLQVTPDLLGLVVPNQGTATSSFVLPNSAALIGAVLHQQLAAIEFDVAGSIVEATTSNALTLTIGVF